MLRITNLKGNVAVTAKTYYSKEDNYYNQDATTCWYGKLAEDLKLHGEVDNNIFEQILNGKLPNGQELITNTKSKNSQRRMGFDITFSAPKSISIQSLVANDIKLLEAHDKAVKSALNELEKHIMVRKKIEGISHKENSQNFLVAMFRHELSRAVDPQVHTHAILMNFTKREDGNYRAISNENILKIQKEIDAIYKNELLKQVQQLGYEIRYAGKNGSFELAHISRQQIEAFSTRSVEIEQYAQSMQNKGYKELSIKEQRITAEKSRAKKYKVDHAKVRQQWQKTAKEINLKLDVKLNPQLEQENLNYKSENKVIDKLVNWAINHHLEKQATTTKSELLISAINQSQGKVSYLDIKNHINKLIEDKKIIESEFLYSNYGEKEPIYKTKQQIINNIIIDSKVTEYQAEEYFNNALKNGRLIQKDTLLTTPKSIQIEQKILAIEKNSRNKFKFISKNHNLDDTTLNPSQKNAVQAILSISNQFMAIQGDAGVGKSFALKIAIEKIQDKKYNVQVLAPYTQQVKSLKSDGLDNTKTLASFLADKKRTIDKNSIIVLDEAGIVSNKQMLALMYIIQKADSRLILLGDTKQTQAIEAGKPFYQLQKYGMETAKITQIQRQKDVQLKQIVKDIADNKIVKSYNDLTTKPDTIQEIKKDEIRYQAIAKEYTQSLIKNENVILIVGENNTRNKINTMIRQNLGLNNTGIRIETFKNIDMSLAEKADIKQYQKDSYIKIDNTLYQIKQIDFYAKTLAVINQENTQINNIHLDKINKTFLQVFDKNTLEISTGELIKFTQQDKKNDIATNDEFIIKSIIDNTIILQNKATNKILNMDKQQLKFIDYGYTKTIHSSQGLTADKTILELDYRSPTTSKNVYYVAVSRAKHKVKIYTNDIEKTKSAVQKEQIKTSSLDISKSYEF